MCLAREHPAWLPLRSLQVHYYGHPDLSDSLWIGTYRVDKGVKYEGYGQLQYLGWLGESCGCIWGQERPICLYVMGYEQRDTVNVLPPLLSCRSKRASCIH